MYKGYLLPLLAITATIASCSSEEQAETDVPVQPEQYSIAFSSNSKQWEGNPVTRAESGLETIYKDFKAWGYKTTGGNRTDGFSDPQTVIGGYKVAWQSNTAGTTTSNRFDWEYVAVLPNQTIKFWDYSATSYRFFGLAPYNAAQAFTLDTDNNEYTYTHNYDFSDQESAKEAPFFSDLWLSDNKGAVIGSTPLKKYNDCIKLTFSPSITKVRFKFMYPADIDPARVIIRNITFHDNRWDETTATKATTPLKGTIKIAYPQFDVPAAEDYMQWTDIEKGYLNMTIPYEETTSSTASEAKKWYYVPSMNHINNWQDNSTDDTPDPDPGYKGPKPYQQSDYILSARINGKPKTAIVPAAYMQWKAGYEYTYIFKITEAGITFDHVLEVYTEWQAGVSDNGNTNW